MLPRTVPRTLPSSHLALYPTPLNYGFFAVFASEWFASSIRPKINSTGAKRLRWEGKSSKGKEANQTGGETAKGQKSQRLTVIMLAKLSTLPTMLTRIKVLASSTYWSLHSTQKKKKKKKQRWRHHLAMATAAADICIRQCQHKTQQWSQVHNRI